MLNALAHDKVPNVRMNVAILCGVYASKVKSTEAGGKTMDLLKALKNDAEFDVSHFAEASLKKF